MTDREVMNDIEERSRKIIVEHLGVHKSRVTTETGIQSDLDADSLDEVELVMAFEEEFNVIIEDSDVEKIRNFGEIVEHINRVLANPE